MASTFTVMIGNLDIQLQHLAPKLDAEFANFYQSVYSGRQPDCSAFDAAAFDFFDMQATYAESVDSFSNNFTPWYNHLLDAGRLVGSSLVWDWALRPALDWEKRTQRRLHKDGAYYYAGMTAILHQDLEGGYLFMHRA